jgi:3-methyl-2-oxobutanoate hydroxymethyltransferase
LTATLLIGDLPFGSYETSDDLAVASARRFIDLGCDAVKLEGAGPMLERVEALVAAGIAVMGHVGLVPQHARTPEEFRAQGRDAASAVSIVNDAIALEHAGCTSLVIEAVPSNVTEVVMRHVTIPVIGIGAGPASDGQVLVYHDLLGLLEARPAKFVKRYGMFAGSLTAAVRAYAEEVRAGEYPGPEHTYKMLPEEIGPFETRFRDDKPLR